MGKKITEVEFKSRCKLKFGDSFDLSNIKFIDMNTPISLKCKIHGEFTKTPKDILRTKGCPKCGGRTKLTNEEFIEKSNIIHNYKYDYSKVKYINKKTKVIITCPIHGDFEQTPDDHANKPAGCPKCKFDKIVEVHSYDKNKFLELAKAKYLNKYDYSKINYINYQTKICIICPIHGEFWQKPNIHINTTEGCQKCGRERANISTSDTQEQFIEKAILTHNDRYDYSLVKYINSQTKVEIICKKHGIFKQVPANHISGQNCPKCILKSQMILFEKLKNNFNKEIILWEQSPDWLDKQRFDIYFPEYNIAVEYNGKQHYEIIDFFGGEAKFENQQERDNLKRQKCLDNNCTLFEVKYDYNDDDYLNLCKSITNLIDTIK